MDSKITNLYETDATIEVTRTYIKQSTGNTEKIHIRPFVTSPCYITVKCGRTVNIGNFESVRLDVSLSAPSYKEELSSVYQQVKEFVFDRLGEEVNNVVENTD